MIQQAVAEIPSFSPSVRKPRIFALVHDVNWEQPALVDSWREIADVFYFDPGWQNFSQYAEDWHEKGKPEFNKIIANVFANPEARPEIFFSYASGRWLYPDTVKAIRALGIKCVNISFDDTAKFYGNREHGFATGVAEIAPHYDLNVTCQNPGDVAKYEKVGARAVFMCLGCVPELCPEPKGEREKKIVFIGAKYGVRPEWIDKLQAAGLPVECYGNGWPNGPVSTKTAYDLQARALIALGFGFIGDSDSLTGLKGRDFEAPLTGALYVTTAHPELSKAFAPNEIMQCLNVEWMRSACCAALQAPQEAIEWGKRARARCLREHTWAARLKWILERVKELPQ